MHPLLLSAALAAALAAAPTPGDAPRPPPAGSAAPAPVLPSSGGASNGPAAALPAAAAPGSTAKPPSPAPAAIEATRAAPAGGSTEDEAGRLDAAAGSSADTKRGGLELRPAPPAAGAPGTTRPGAESAAPRDDSLAGTDAPDLYSEPDRDVDESLGWVLFRTLMVLGIVVASIYLSLNFGLRKLMGVKGAPAPGRGLIQMVERMPLDPKRSLFIVKAAGEYLLVGAGETGMTLLNKLNAAEVERLQREQLERPSPPLPPFFQKFLAQKKQPPPSA